MLTHTQSHTGQDGGIAEDSGREFSCTQNHCLQSIDFYTDFTNTQIHAHTPYYIEHVLIQHLKEEQPRRKNQKVNEPEYY